MSDMSESLLDELEWTVYDYLSKAWSEFIKLPTLHPNDRVEFAQAINVCKNIIMARPVARELVEKFKDIETGYVKPEDLERELGLDKEQDT